MACWQGIVDTLLTQYQSAHPRRQSIAQRSHSVDAAQTDSGPLSRSGSSQHCVEEDTPLMQLQGARVLRCRRMASTAAGACAFDGFSCVQAWSQALPWHSICWAHMSCAPVSEARGEGHRAHG